MKILLIRFKYVAGERSGTDKWQSSGGHLLLVKLPFSLFNRLESNKLQKLEVEDALQETGGL